VNDLEREVRALTERVRELELVALRRPKVEALPALRNGATPLDGRVAEAEREVAALRLALDATARERDEAGAAILRERDAGRGGRYRQADVGAGGWPGETRGGGGPTFEAAPTKFDQPYADACEAVEALERKFARANARLNALVQARAHYQVENW
jgi:hypothetical protein